MKPRDHALLGDLPEDNGSIEQGTVGWNDETGDNPHYRLEAEEVLLVKVRLFRGYNPDRDERPPENRAGGTPLWCRVSAPNNYVPEVGANVIVSIPAGGWTSPGAAMIIGIAAVTPPNQIGASKAKLDYGENCDLVIKARSITLTDYEDRFMTIGPRYGFKVGDADANGCMLKAGKWQFYSTDGEDDPDCKCMLELSEGLARLMVKNADGSVISGFTSDSTAGDFTVAGKRFVAFTDGGMLGRTATPATLISYGVSPSVLASPMWSISPVPTP